VPTSKNPQVRSVAAALEVTLASDAYYDEPINAALVSFCRSLAQQISEAERNGGTASTHVQAAYLSALKDLNRGRGKQTKKGAARGDSGGGASGLAGIRGSVAGVSTTTPRKRSA